MRVDLSDVLEAEERAYDELGNVAYLMHDAAKAGAEDEQRRHEYVNRTYKLQTNTTAEIEKIASTESIVTLQMDTEYASYVVNRGLSTIEQQAEKVERAIGRAFAEQAKRVAG